MANNVTFDDAQKAATKVRRHTPLSISFFLCLGRDWHLFPGKICINFPQSSMLCYYVVNWISSKWVKVDCYATAWWQDSGVPVRELEIVICIFRFFLLLFTTFRHTFLSLLLVFICFTFVKNDTPFLFFLERGIFMNSTFCFTC